MFFHFFKLVSFLLIDAILANGRVMISKHENILSDEMIDEINQLGTTWKVDSSYKFTKIIVNLLHIN